jgi:hypothetical protein
LAVLAEVGDVTGMSLPNCQAAPVSVLQVGSIHGKPASNACPFTGFPELLLGVRGSSGIGALRASALVVASTGLAGPPGGMRIL